MKIADYGKAITSYIESPTTAQKLQAKDKAQTLNRTLLAEGTTPKAKPFTIEQFKDKANIYVGALHNNALPLADIKSALNKFTQKGIDDGTFTADDAIKIVQDLKSYYKDLAQKQRLRGVIEEGIGTVEREDFKRGGDGSNPASQAALKEIHEAGAKRVTDKVERFKELVKQDKTPNEAKMIVMKEFGIERNVKAGTPKWMTRGKKELIEEGFEFTESKRGPEPTGDAKDKATKKRKQVIGKEEAQFEERLKKEKTKTGFGKKFETAHTANIFQARKLGIEYPIDALAIQATKVNQEVAEILNEELLPLYKKQITLRNKLKKNNTFALRKELDELNRLIADTVATGGKQGDKAANVLKPIIVDPKTLKGKILDLGFDTSSEVFTVPGATTKKTKAGDLEDLMARMNIKEKVIQKASEIDRPEKALLSDKFKTAFTKGLKTTGKVIKPVGYAFGVNAVKNAVSKADDMGIELSLADKIIAFDSGDADIAINNYKRRNDPEFAAAERAKDLAQMTDDFEEVGKDTTFGKYNDQIKNIKLP